MSMMTRRNNIICRFVVVFLLTIIYYIYYKITFHGKNDEFDGRKLTTGKMDLAISESKLEIGMILPRLQQAFEKNGVIAYKENSKSTFSTQLACASELFVSECNGAGLAAMLLMTLDHLSTCRHIGGVPTIFWRNCGTVCPSNATVNSWNWFFEPLNPNVEEKAMRILCFGNYFGPRILSMESAESKEGEYPELLNLSFKPRHIPNFEGFGIITHGIRVWANGLLKQYVKINPRIQDMVDRFYDKHLSGHTVLAVHVRGTDHASETNEGKLPPLITWIQNAKNIMKSLPTPTKIFIASDNSESIKKFINVFGKKVVFTKALRAIKYDGREVHHSNHDPYKLGRDVLIDILLMARADHFLHAESSVAALVTYFNPGIHTYFLETSEVSTKDRRVQSKHLKHATGHISIEPDDFPDDRYLDQTEEYLLEETQAECFQMNSQYSVCPNMKKFIFLDPRKMQELKQV